MFRRAGWTSANAVPGRICGAEGGSAAVLRNDHRMSTSDFGIPETPAHHTFEEASEIGGHGPHQARHGARWVPIAAAILAVVTAIFTLFTAQRSTESLVEKNEAILQTTRASDAYNEYEARSVKEHIYESLVQAGVARNTAALERVAQHERAAGKPAFAKAKLAEQRATEANTSSARLRTQFVTMEIGITLLDISIVLVSISALVTTPALTIVAGSAAALGLLTCVVGFFR